MSLTGLKLPHLTAFLLAGGASREGDFSCKGMDTLIARSLNLRGFVRGATVSFHNQSGTSVWYTAMNTTLPVSSVADACLCSDPLSVCSIMSISHSKARKISRLARQCRARATFPQILLRHLCVLTSLRLPKGSSRRPRQVLATTLAASFT